MYSFDRIMDNALGECLGTVKFGIGINTEKIEPASKNEEIKY